MQAQDKSKHDQMRPIFQHLWPLDYLPLIFLHCEVGQPGHFPFASWISQVSSAPHVPSGQGLAHRTTTGHSGARWRPPRSLLAATRPS